MAAKPSLKKDVTDPQAGPHSLYSDLGLRLRPALLITIAGVLVLAMLALFSGSLSPTERLDYYADLQYASIFGYLVIVAGLGLMYMALAPDRGS